LFQSFPPFAISRSPVIVVAFVESKGQSTSSTLHRRSHSTVEFFLIGLLLQPTDGSSSTQAFLDSFVRPPAARSVVRSLARSL
ncbi:hypothetical protein, partial [Enterococcus faecalis]|uniref:hypothetical protein n=1 Tax=Enterococcus faecalis TaxID=1351 RepID=UPI0022F0904F